MKNTFALLVFLAVISLSACNVAPHNPGDQLHGMWRSSVGGFPVLVEYSENHVRLDGHEPVPYSLGGSELVVDGDLTSRRILRFEGRNTMFQVDPVSGVEQRFERVREAYR